MYNHLSIYYFTGTGNSYRAATWLAETARQRGLEAQCTAMDPAQPPAERSGGANQLVGVVGPTHGFTAPWWMIRFALRLPPGRGAHAFILFTRGATKIGQVFIPGMEGTAAYLLALILRLKGYQIRGAAGLDMPSNWITLYPGLDPAVVEVILARSQPRAVGFLERLLDGKTAFSGLVPLAIGLLLLPVSTGYLLMGRFFLARLFYASSKCNGCGVCASNCPVGAIKMQGSAHPRPYWTFSCESCMRCMNFCPRGAVEASYPLAGLIIYLISFPLAALLLDFLAGWFAAAAGLKGSLVEWIIAYPIMLLSIAVAYAVFSVLLRVPFFNRLVTMLTPTRYYRRYHEPGARLGDLK